MPDRSLTLTADNPRVRTIARWLCAATIALILYGSLFPFRFTADGANLAETMAHLGFARASRGDIVANLLLYMPLGLFLMLARPAGWTRWQGFLFACAFGSLLSFSVEVLQGYSPERVQSLTDLALNAAGAALGSWLAVAYQAMGHTIHVPGIGPRRPHPIPMSLLTLWLAFRLAPFVPTIDFQKYKDALKPVLVDPQIVSLDVLRYLVGWLVLGYAVRQVWKREYAIPAMAAIVFIVLVGRVVVVGKALSPSELVALAMCVPLAALLAVIQDRRRTIVLALLLAIVITVRGLEPFTLAPRPHGFSWVPFMSSLSDNLEVNYSVLLEKFFWYFALVWLLVRRGLGVVGAMVVTATLLALIEAAQAWIPGRSAEITDPLLAICAAILIGLAGTRAHEPRFAIGGHRG
jgi:VanZ family protein